MHDTSTRMTRHIYLAFCLCRWTPVVSTNTHFTHMSASAVGNCPIGTISVQISHHQISSSVIICILSTKVMTHWATGCMLHLNIRTTVMGIAHILDAVLATLWPWHWAIAHCLLPCLPCSALLTSSAVHGCHAHCWDTELLQCWTVLGVTTRTV